MCASLQHLLLLALFFIGANCDSSLAGVFTNPAEAFQALDARLAESLNVSVANPTELFEALSNPEVERIFLSGTLVLSHIRMCRHWIFELPCAT